MKKRIFALVVASILAFGSVLSVSADELEVTDTDRDAVFTIHTHTDSADELAYHPQLYPEPVAPELGDCAFTDVPRDSYFYKAVVWAFNKGITTGTSDTTFSPKNTCTRGQTVTFLWRAMGEPEPTTQTNPFVDVKPDAFYYKAVLWAYENNITTGVSANRFDPSGVVSRGQFVTFLWRTTGKKEAKPYGFSDIQSGKYYYGAVNWAANYGVTTGTSATTFSPDAPCVRAQVVTFLHRYMTTINAADKGVIPNDGIDDTEALQVALYNAVELGECGAVYVPAGTYDIDLTKSIEDSGDRCIIKMRSNTSLILDADAVLRVKTASTHAFDVIKISNKENVAMENVTVSGGTIEGERDSHTAGGDAEGMGIGIYDAKNVTISHVNIRNHWGDGIYIGTMNLNDNLYGADKVSVQNCTIERNRRSNISIVDGSNITIDNCKIKNAQGAAPQCGIYIEPNRNSSGVIPDDEICRNITIKNTVVDAVSMDDYYGQYFTFQSHYYPDNPGYLTCENIKISGCVFNGDCGNYSGKNCVIENTVIKGCLYYHNGWTTMNNVSCGSTWGIF